MKSIIMGFGVGLAVLLSALTVQAQAAPKGDQCPAQLQAANNVLKANAVNENLLESEVNQKRKQVAALGMQLQEERQAHDQTKKALAKLQETAKKPETPKE